MERGTCPDYDFIITLDFKHKGSGDFRNCGTEAKMICLCSIDDFLGTRIFLVGTDYMFLL